MWSILFAFHQGGNDLKRAELLSEDDRNELVTDLCDKLWGIVKNLFANDPNDDDIKNYRDNRVLAFGMPPYDVSEGTTGGHNGPFPFNREAFQQWTEAIMGICAARRIPFYDPFHITITNLPDYQEDDGNGVHYTVDGANAVWGRGRLPD